MNDVRATLSRLKTMKTKLENIGSDLLAVHRRMIENEYDEQDIENIDQAATCACNASEWIADSLEGFEETTCTE